MKLGKDKSKEMIENVSPYDDIIDKASSTLDDYALLEKQMMDKYGFNRDYIAEGPYHASINRVLLPLKASYDELTPQEKKHILGTYSMPGGTFTLSENNKGELKCSLKQNKLNVIKNIFKR